MEHKQIFELCYYGNGFEQLNVYRLPIHLRNFYYRQLSDIKKKESEQSNKSTSNKSFSGPNVKVKK